MEGQAVVRHQGLAKSKAYYLRFVYERRRTREGSGDKVDE